MSLAGSADPTVCVCHRGLLHPDVSTNRRGGGSGNGSGALGMKLNCRAALTLALGCWLGENWRCRR
eukprot:1801031-Amphidinium_carterae.3